MLLKNDIFFDIFWYKRVPAQKEMIMFLNCGPLTVFLIIRPATSFFQNLSLAKTWVWDPCLIFKLRKENNLNINWLSLAQFLLHFSKRSQRKPGSGIRGFRNFIWYSWQKKSYSMFKLSHHCWLDIDRIFQWYFWTHFDWKSDPRNRDASNRVPDLPSRNFWF